MKMIITVNEIESISYCNNYQLNDYCREWKFNPVMKLDAIDIDF